ncbi:enoyl-CoA hydratase/isomerase family protein [Gracilibacillus sp. Marseille-QA3620]
MAVLNRPEVRNAVNFEMMDQLAAAIQLASEDEGVKAFVLTGAGEDAFCSGGDLREFHQLHTFQDAHRMLFKMSNVLRQLAFLPKPCFCFVNGAAVGGGLELATACDFRFVKKGARLGFIQVRQAITTGWGGGSLLLEKLDSQRALDWLMSGRIISVEEGVESRFILSSMDTMEKDDMMNKLEPYMQHEGTAVMAYKEMLIRKWRETGLAERMEQEVERCALLWEKPAHLEAVNRFISK